MGCTTTDAYQTFPKHLYRVAMEPNLRRRYSLFVSLME